MRLSEDVQAFLGERRFGVLATIDSDGLPQQTVMWYELDDDEIVMNTARGRHKDRFLQRDPRISLCIEDGYRYVTLVGTTRLIDDQEIAQADIARLARRYEGDSAARMIENFQRQQRVTIRMSIERAILNGFGQ